MKEPIDPKIVRTAVHLSGVEISLGSLLHAFHIPFSGHFLSLNQGVFLEQAIEKEKSRYEAFKFILICSNCISLMKSLSPAGRKLGPMISISTQGLLLGSGFLIFGNNLFGRMMGMGLLSFWAFLQPLVSFFLLFGTDLIPAFEYYTEKMEKKFLFSGEQLLYVVLLIIFIKFILAICLPLFSPKITFYLEQKLPKQKKTKYKKRKTNTLLFVVSIFLMISFYFFHGHSKSEVFWLTLRPVSIYLLITYVSQSDFLKKIIARPLMKIKPFQRLLKTAKEVKEQI